MGSALGFVKGWWGQVFMLLALIALLDKFTGFKSDLGAITSLADTTISDLKV
jgi:hypothetical protein